MSFENAAVTKGLIAFCAVSSTFVGIFDIKHYFHLQLIPHISVHHQYWRLISHNLAFSNSSDVFLASLILYNVGVPIERQFGSIKYASFATVSLFVATFLEFITILLFYRVGIDHIAMGPSTLVFAILYQYSRIVPAVYTFKIFGVPLNNKSFNYLLALQLAVSRLPGSAVAAIAGILTGQIYRSDLAPLKAYRLPPTIVRFAIQFLSPLVGSLRPPRRSNRALPDGFASGGAGVRSNSDAMRQNEEVITTARNSGLTGLTSRAQAPADVEPAASQSVMREWVDELTGRADRANAGLRVASETEIFTLTSMFPTLEREVVIGALQRSPNIEAAVETLLASQN
ncbi:hypothetical protein D9613_004924 [Agrocybe pediades]|uniref:CUE domain-containing protein n=1 Tax=Agrocybe pediades TaxID=84607 RepID=A0A8H4R0G8_9AGAR|nr:hypothetical protein D9613_004924 [Agrocybe pediades]